MSTRLELHQASLNLYERIKLGLGEDEWYGTDTHDVNVYIWGNDVKAVAYNLNEDKSPNYDTCDTLWIMFGVIDNEEESNNV